MEEHLIKAAAKMAADSRGFAVTFRTAVGACVLSTDGELYEGFNIETYGHKGYHAEESALIYFMLLSEANEEVHSIFVSYKDAGTGENDFPACPSCWSLIADICPENVLIYTVDEYGNIIKKRRFKDLFNCNIYPGKNIKKAKPRTRF